MFMFKYSQLTKTGHLLFYLNSLSLAIWHDSFGTIILIFCNDVDSLIILLSLEQVTG